MKPYGQKRVMGKSLMVWRQRLGGKFHIWMPVKNRKLGRQAKDLETTEE